MKRKIKNYFNSLNPEKLGLKSHIKVKSVSKLGQGVCNLNYLVKTNQGKFIFRLNADLKNKTKSKKEFNALKIIEKSKISPKAYILDESRKFFDSDFIILEYLDGKLCTKVKPYFDENMIKNLAKLLAKIHSIKITSKMKRQIARDYLDYRNQIKKMESYLKYIKKNSNDYEFLGILDEIVKKLKNQIRGKTLKSKLVLSHGDFHSGNVIINKGNFFLIDFERFEITNQASALSHIFIHFKRGIFTGKQRVVFLSEYRKHVKTNKGIELEIDNFIPLKIMGLFLWSVKFILKVKNNEMHKEFLSNHERNINNAIRCFKQALKFGAIDNKYKNLNLRRLLG